MLCPLLWNHFYFSVFSIHVRPVYLHQSNYISIVVLHEITDMHMRVEEPNDIVTVASEMELMRILILLLHGESISLIAILKFLASCPLLPLLSLLVIPKLHQ